jgi:glycosyltransferase involved in cell wall biosynthesis
MSDLSVVITTYNEEKNIGRCLDSVGAIADEVIVLDSFSGDHTVSIAVAKGAIVHQSEFSGYVKQKNKAIQLAANDHVLLLDADEALSKELANAILRAKDEFKFAAYSMNRCNVFCGSFIKRGLWYPDRKLRLFDKSAGYCGGMNPHDKILMHEKVKVCHLRGDLLHYTYDSLEEYMERNDEVSSIAARSLYEAGIRRSWTKLFFSPLWSFINGYFLRLGFLDGYKGFIIAIHTANQTYTKYQKLRRLHRQELNKVVWE